MVNISNVYEHNGKWSFSGICGSGYGCMMEWMKKDTIFLHSIHCHQNKPSDAVPISEEVAMAVLRDGYVDYHEGEGHKGEGHNGGRSRSWRIPGSEGQNWSGRGYDYVDTINLVEEKLRQTAKDNDRALRGKELTQKPNTNELEYVSTPTGIASTYWSEWEEIWLGKTDADWTKAVGERLELMEKTRAVTKGYFTVDMVKEAWRKHMESWGCGGPTGPRGGGPIENILTVKSKESCSLDVSSDISLVMIEGEGGCVILNLPDPSLMTGKKFTVKNQNQKRHYIIVQWVDSIGGEFYEGEFYEIDEDDGEVIDFVSNGAEWTAMSENKRLGYGCMLGPDSGAWADQAKIDRAKRAELACKLTNNSPVGPLELDKKEGEMQDGYDNIKSSWEQLMLDLGGKKVEGGLMDIVANPVIQLKSMTLEGWDTFVTDYIENHEWKPVGISASQIKRELAKKWHEEIANEAAAKGYFTKGAAMNSSIQFIEEVVAKDKQSAETGIDWKTGYAYDSAEYRRVLEDNTRMLRAYEAGLSPQDVSITVSQDGGLDIYSPRKITINGHGLLESTKITSLTINGNCEILGDVSIEGCDVMLGGELKVGDGGNLAMTGCNINVGSREPLVINAEGGMDSCSIIDNKIDLAMPELKIVIGKNAARTKVMVGNEMIPAIQKVVIEASATGETKAEIWFPDCAILNGNVLGTNDTLKSMVERGVAMLKPFPNVTIRYTQLFGEAENKDNHDVINEAIQEAGKQLRQQKEWRKTVLEPAIEQFRQKQKTDMPSGKDLEDWKEIFGDTKLTWTAYPSGETGPVFGEKDTGVEDMDDKLDRCLEDYLEKHPEDPINHKIQPHPGNGVWAASNGFFLPTHLDQDDVVRLSKSDAYMLRESLAEHPDTDDITLFHLGEDIDERVSRMAIAVGMQRVLDKARKDNAFPEISAEPSPKPETKDNTWSSVALMGLAGLAGAFASTMLEKPNGVRVADVIEDIVPEEVASVLEQKVS